MNVPEALRYRDTHEWVRVEDGVAVVGITDYAQGELGDVVYVELPELGRKVEAGEAVAVIESVKTASDIYAPVSGEVVEVNELLAEHPEKVNVGSSKSGWKSRRSWTRSSTPRATRSCWRPRGRPRS